MAPPNPNHKRPLEVIDLTDDSDFVSYNASYRAPKAQKRGAAPAYADSVSSSSNFAGSSQEAFPRNYTPTSSVSTFSGTQTLPSASQAHLGDDEFTDDELDDALLSQSFLDHNEYIFYGTVNTKAVGCRYYNGYVTMGEMVLIRREPNNQYDSNAIQVKNVKGDQIGHIPRTMAQKLAPFMDRNALIIEGAAAGPKDHYECPLSLRLYGSNNPIERNANKAELQRLRLTPLSGIKELEELERRRLKELAERDRLVKKALKAGSSVGSGGSQQWDLQPSQYAGNSSQATPLATLEDIMKESERFNPRNAGEMAERFGSNKDHLEAMPMAGQPSALKTQLLPYQRQGLKWLLDKEGPTLPPPGSTEAVQLWRRAERGQTKCAFLNIATGFSVQNEPPQLASGGILADDMGLGKTMQIISLILADRELNVPRRNGVSYATLILAPLSVMSNWSGQIEHHVKELHALKVLIYHGAKREPITPETIKNWDVVISTYGAVRSEYWSRSKKAQKPATGRPMTGISSINWRRVVLDEGHNIRNPAAKTTTAVCALEAQSRWVLSGTPIINSLKDLYSLVRFIGLSGGMNEFELFNRAIIRPLNQGQEKAGRVLQELMRSICLRRTKDMPFIDLKLPELSEYIHKIEFLPQEKDKYDALQAEAKGTLDDYQSRNKLPQGDAGKAYRHLLEVLLRLRQVCNHWKLCGANRLDALRNLDGQVIVDLTPENKAALEQMLQLNIEAQDDCPICMDTLSDRDPVITVCTHAFCYACIEKVIETQKKCPMCRAPIEDTSKLVRPAVDAPPPLDIDIEETSSKVEALIAILTASRQGKGNKTVVFSQWTSFLDVVQKQLGKHGFKYARIDGTMPAQARDVAMESLEKDPEVTVLLASLSVCSVGLNLVAANQVILSDSWWAPAIEDQAVDRVHRLGQTKPTTVFRLVMEGSIEEEVLKIQEDKRKLMALALSEKKAAERGAKKERRMADIMRLLG